MTDAAAHRSGPGRSGPDRSGARADAPRGALRTRRARRGAHLPAGRGPLQRRALLARPRGVGDALARRAGRGTRLLSRASSRSPPACCTSSVATCAARGQARRGSRAAAPLPRRRTAGSSWTSWSAQGAACSTTSTSGDLPYLIPPVIRFTDADRTRLRADERRSRGARLDGRGPRVRVTHCGARRRSAPSRTSRSPGAPRARARSRRWRASRPPPHASSASTAWSSAELADAIVVGGR